jgi:hypothetical protein
MFVRLCLLSVLAMGMLAEPAASRDGASLKWGATAERQPVQAQLQRFITPKIRHRPAPCRGFGQC